MRQLDTTVLLPPVISVVVPTSNRADDLHRALMSLTQQITDGRFDYEIVVVDKASTDNTKDVIARFLRISPVPVRSVPYMPCDNAPIHFTGLCESVGDWLAFFDEEEFADPHWLQNLLKVALENNALVVVGAVHLDLDESVVQELSPACRNVLRESRPYAGVQPYGPRVTPNADNLLVSRQVLDVVSDSAKDRSNGYSNGTLVEDARAAGIVPWHAPDAIVRHRVSTDRLQPKSFHHEAQDAGGAQADADFRDFGTAFVVCRCVARLVQATLYLPARVRAAWCPPGYGSAQSSMIWWRTEGYVRRTLSVLAPTLFPQKRFHDRADCRAGRTVGA
ncbi:MAG: glycosyltransferase family A protein [Planctomycetaceae bacterium]